MVYKNIAIIKISFEYKVSNNKCLWKIKRIKFNRRILYYFVMIINITVSK